MKYKTNCVKTLRVAPGLTQTEFASLISIALQLLSIYEGEKTHIPAKTMVTIMNKIGVKPEYFFDNNLD